MGQDALEELRRLVVVDPALRCRLLAVTDRDAFVTRVVEVSQECGLVLSADDVVEALHAAKRRRIERWV
jgi:hypothetical protein